MGCADIKQTNQILSPDPNIDANLAPSLLGWAGIHSVPQAPNPQPQSLCWEIGARLQFLMRYSVSYEAPRKTYLVSPPRLGWDPPWPRSSPRPSLVLLLTWETQSVNVGTRLEKWRPLRVRRAGCEPRDTFEVKQMHVRVVK